MDPPPDEYNAYVSEDNINNESRVESATETDSHIVDVSILLCIPFNTLIDRYAIFVELVIQVLNTYGLDGSDTFFKIQVRTEVGCIELLIQKFDCYQLGVVRDGVVYENLRGNTPRRFKGSVALGFSENHSNLKGLKMGLKWFKDAVNNILSNNDYINWQYDLTLLTVVICEGLRFHPLFNRLIQMMREGLKNPWILPDPFPEIIASWSLMSKFMCGAVKHKGYRARKLKGMDIKDLKALLALKDGVPSKEGVQFAFYCVKWPHVKSIQTGFCKKKGDWVFKPPKENGDAVSESSSSDQNVPTATPEVDPEDHQPLHLPELQVIWAGFDRLEIGPASFRHVLLLGYQNGFQVIDVEDVSDFTVLVSKPGGPVTFLQLLHKPTKFDENDEFIPLHPLLMVVAGDEAPRSALGQNRTYLSTPGRDGSNVAESGTSVDSSTAVRFYSLQSNCYEKVLRFRSTVFMVRCSPTIVAVGLEKEIHCIDAVTLENKFTVPTYPVPQSGGQGKIGVNFGYGPLAVGPRWLAYASNKLIVSNSGHLSPMNLTPGISSSTSPSNGSLVARYAMESSKQLAAGIITLGDKGYKTFSKYNPEMLQDRPIASSKPGLKAGNASSEVDNAGMVIVKDVVSEAVISQFRAHPSPLSALCFDPSGTLLVTASIDGNNVNIFRIMPCTRTDSSNQIHDWNSSHVLLYKLHRGITSAVIQDISFSLYCQWISIVTSNGTSHVFALSPFGGDAGYRAHGSHGHSINPVRSLPWWSTPSFVVDEQPFPPPPPLTLSVVGRIKNSSSFAGKADIPSGAVASVFHNSMICGKQDVPKMVNSLLVYTPSGYVVQYELLPSMGVQNIDAGSKNQPVSYQPGQDDELGVVFQSRQWWQVCRRLDSPEREECIFTTSVYNEGEKLVKDDSLKKIDSLKQNDRVHLFLSNAEVQINSGRLPLCQHTKVHFYVMRSVSVEGFSGGETQIENILCHEVDIRRKDLLPVYEQFNSIKSGWDDR